MGLRNSHQCPSCPLLSHLSLRSLISNRRAQNCWAPYHCTATARSSTPQPYTQGMVWAFLPASLGSVVVLKSGAGTCCHSSSVAPSCTEPKELPDCSAALGTGQWHSGASLKEHFCSPRCAGERCEMIAGMIYFGENYKHFLMRSTKYW